MENKRLIGLDFIRVFAMVVVTSIHFVVYSDVIHAYNAIPVYNKVFISFLQSLFPLFVNLFVMLSGFLLCRKQFNLHRILKLWLTVYAASAIVSVATVIVAPSTISVSSLVHGMFPILSHNYWYFSVYFMLLALMPLLNILTLRIALLKNIVILGG